MTHTTFLRINEVVVSVQNLDKVILNEQAKTVSLLVKGRAESFVFDNAAPEQAVGFFIEICNILRQTQEQIPFLFFANMAVRVDLLSSINVDGSAIVMSTVGYTAGDVFPFASTEETKKIFNELLQALGITPPTPKPEETPAEAPAPKKRKKRSPDQAPPDKPRRK